MPSCNKNQKSWSLRGDISVILSPECLIAVHKTKLLQRNIQRPDNRPCILVIFIPRLPTHLREMGAELRVTSQTSRSIILIVMFGVGSEGSLIGLQETHLPLGWLVESWYKNECINSTRVGFGFLSSSTSLFQHFSA